MSYCDVPSGRLARDICGSLASRGSLALSLTALIALQPLAASAQSSTPAEPNTARQTDSESASGLEEVTVTARRRAENIENVPISITAFDPAELAERTIRTESDLQVAVPGLIVRTTAVSTQQNYSIRGQSIDAFTGSSPAVLAYVNDVEANSGAPTTFFDLSSIQVLKGPQGTLFGRNTTGGAVLFTTAEPGNTFGGFATVRGGNLDLKETLGAVDLPVSDKILLRIAGDYYDRDGYQHDIATNQDFGGAIRRAGRVTLVLKPLDGLQSKTVVEYGATGGYPVINSIFSYYPCGAKGLVSSAACLFGPSSATVVGLDRHIDFPGAWNAYLAAHPGANPGGIPGALTLQQQQLGIWGVDSLQPNSIHQDNWSATNTTTYDLTGDVQVKNIVGVSRSYVDFIADQAGVPFGLSIDYNTATGALGNKTTQRNVSEEAQVLGKMLDTKLDYVVGFYFSDNRHTEHDDLTYFDVSPIIPPAPSTFIFVATARSEAGYAQGTYDLSSMTGVSGLKATGGFRYTWETDGLSYPVVPGSGALLAGGAPESKQFSEPSWQVGLDYELRPDLLLYIVQRGSWRSGGFNGYSPSKETLEQFGGNEFLPEKTHDVEVGAKFHGAVMGLPTQGNIAIYNQWITDIQRVIYDFAGSNAAAFTGNIPAGQVRGVEFDAEISPVAWLTLGVNGAYTDAFYTDNTGVTQGGGILHYGPFGDVSRLAGSVFTQVRLPTPDPWGKMSVRADLYAQSSEYFSNLASTITPGTQLPGYSVLNLRYDWNQVFGTGMTLSAFAKNALNRGYYTGGESFGVDFGLNDAAPAEPRTYGAELTYRF
jgi:iron complex outermembrane receptor protein